MEANAGRRRFLDRARRLVLGGAALAALPRAAGGTNEMNEALRARPARSGLTLFLCGDVMTGRGIDQVLPHPGDPALHEPYAASALDYVRLAEKVNGPIKRPVAFDYVWGDALAEWERARPDVRIVNLETAVTTRNDWQRAKGIHYRMNPANVGCLAAARIDCCVLANNHVLDWGDAGLVETLETLRRAGMRTAGAGHDLHEAAAPAVLATPAGRVLVFSYGLESSGIPPQWAAGPGKPGVDLLADMSDATLRRIAAKLETARRVGDVAVASIHWGENWGYEVPPAHRSFARALIERGFAVVHGHSSHHPLGIEVYRERPILYGCGDFLNDYEGIGGYAAYRGDLCLMYFLTLDAKSGSLEHLGMVPLQIRNFRLRHASAEDARWLREVLDGESRRLGSRVEVGADGALELRWGA